MILVGNIYSTRARGTALIQIYVPLDVHQAKQSTDLTYLPER